MVRAPCCEKMGLKKGPWTTEEDQTLINYIRQYGHGNWRALPKLAGLLRCGKSCRLRWTNYLRPDIKRGNFTTEEEETIIKLHEMLGNRWSTIAARLPGRTDNEIKNVWHTHLKKRLKQNHESQETKHHHSVRTQSSCDQSSSTSESEPGDFSNQFPKIENQNYVPVSPQQSSSDFSSELSTVTFSNFDFNMKDDQYSASSEIIPMIDENFWMEVLPEEEFSLKANFSSSNVEEMEYWYNLLMKAEEQLEVSDL